MSSTDIPKSDGMRTEHWKYLRYFEQVPVYEELYDLEADPHESRNLASDPLFADRLRQMRRRCTELSEINR